MLENNAVKEYTTLELIDMAREGRDAEGYARRMIQAGMGGSLYLSDAIIGNQRGGGHVLVALGETYETMVSERQIEDLIEWKLKVLYNEWGEPVYPGDVVTLRIQKPEYKSVGKPYPANLISEFKMNGTYDEMFVTTKEFKIDKKGCISCYFPDAVYFLNTFGKHGVSHMPFSRHKREHPERPAKGDDGKTRIPWYWRYEEQSPEMYKALPTLKPRTKEAAPEKKTDLTLDNAGN